MDGLGIQDLAVGTIFAGIEHILGLKIRNQNLTLEPCIPNKWEEYFVQYRFGESIYNIKVRNVNKTNIIQKMFLNGIEVKEKEIKLIDNKKISEIEIIL